MVTMTQTDCTTLSPAIEQACEFGGWHFDPTDGQLSSKTKQVRLQPRLAKLLAILIANERVLLSRDQLIESLWPNKAINEDALSRCIAELRATLGDNRNAPSFIETVPKKGYRFIESAKPVTTGNHFLQNTKIFSIAITFGVLLFVSLILLTWKSPDTAHSEDISRLIKSALVKSHRVTADDLLEQQPALANNGQNIAFSMSHEQQLKIRIINTSGEIIHQFSNDEYHLLSPTFSPDDSALAVVGINGRQCKIIVYQLPALDKEVIGDCYFPSLSILLNWSPSGNSIAYVGIEQPSSVQTLTEEKVSTRTTNAAIWTYHFPSKKHIQWTQPTALNVFDSNPKFSPDGQHLAFTRGTTSYRKIYLVDFSESLLPPSNEALPPVREITQGKGFINGLDWFGDSQHLIYDSDELGDRNLWLVNKKTLDSIIVGGRDAQYPSVDKSNQHLIYQEIRYNANIWRVKLGDLEAEPSQIIKSIKYNNFPAYSPDGKQIAFVSNRQGKTAIWLYDLTNQLQHKLISIPQQNLITPNWSADGKKMLVSSRGAQGYRCYQVDLESKTHQLISGFKQAHYACAYTEKGDIYAVSKEPQETSQLLKLDPNGKLKQLTHSGISRFHISSTGRIVYSLPNDKGLYTMDLDGNNKQVLLADFARRFDAHWTVKDHFLYYPVRNLSSSTGGEPSENGIWRLNLNTGYKQQVTKLLPSAIGLTISVDPTHSEILMSRTDSRQADIYMANVK